MDSELEKIEAELGRLSPECMPEGLIRRMEAAMEAAWQAEKASDKGAAE